LIIAIAISLIVAGVFAARLINRFRSRPTYEPVAAWMSVPYVARSYGVPPPQIGELYAAIGAAQPARGPGTGGPDRKPIGEIARELGKDADELVNTLQIYLDARPKNVPRDPNFPSEPPGGRPKPHP
jgi:hypothetical protein